LIELSTKTLGTETKFGKWRRSVETFLDLAAKKEDRMLRVFALRYAARYYYCLGDIPKAIHLIQQALLQFDGSCLQKDIAEMELYRYRNT
jgi:hypothetical protein